MNDQQAAEAAHELFGAQFPLLKTYVDILRGEGLSWGLLGPREADRLWSRHILNSVALEPLLPRAATVIDVGSGAGLPGVPLGIHRPDLRVTLLEPLLRRTRFLELVLTRLAAVGGEVRVPSTGSTESVEPSCLSRSKHAELGGVAGESSLATDVPSNAPAASLLGGDSETLSSRIDQLRSPQLRVVRGRAEEHDQWYDVVTCRAVAPLVKLLPWCAPLLAPGGMLLALKGDSAVEEVAAATKELSRRRLRAEVLSLGGAAGGESTQAIRVVSNA